VATLAAVTSVWVFTSGTEQTLGALAISFGLPNGAVEGDRMTGVLRGTLPRVALVAGIAGLLVWAVANRRSDAGPRGLALFALVAIDLLVVGIGQNPTLDTRFFARPQWSAAIAPTERVYISSGPNLAYVQLPYVTFPIPPDMSNATISSLYDGVFPSTP